MKPWLKLGANALRIPQICFGPLGESLSVHRCDQAMPNQLISLDMLAYNPVQEAHGEHVQRSAQQP